jgi:restriction system protein
LHRLGYLCLSPTTLLGDSILTTGTFTAGARKEAVRDGVPAIELVDRDQFIEMFERLELGLRQRVAFEVEASFFDQFQV